MAESCLSIENYGIIGDLNTTALIGLDGSIDFFCYPQFDSPSVFAKLLDTAKGGFFRLAPDMENVKLRQLYLPDTNVLVTRFMYGEGITEVIDCMPVSRQGAGRKIIRIVKAVKGDIAINMRCAPRFNYARTGHAIRLANGGRTAIVTPAEDVQPQMRLHSEMEMRVEGDDVVARFELKSRQSAHFCMAWSEEKDECTVQELDSLLVQTVNFWREWVERNTYTGRWREMVIRSALVLKLLTFHKTGTMVASPTFGLPEAIGQGRNWDYRYCWIRDSAFTIYSLLRLGYQQESIDYMQWIKQRFAASDASGQLNLMYRIDGSDDMSEETLLHLEGYKGSAPVRIGNQASSQRQLDIYGELIDAIYLSTKYVQGISHDGWLNVCRTVDYVCNHWEEKDRGIWEIRGEPQYFLHSRLMCWVAVDRAIRMAVMESRPAPIIRWGEVRTKIYHSIFTDFWNEELQSFVQYKGGRTMDASLLMMPMMKFIAPTDPRWLSTLERIGEELGADALVKRYNGGEIDFEGVDGSMEGSFTMCSFWYIECLARSGQVSKARLLFEKMLGYANHLGLYSEELGTDGAHLGNFPQAFTHMALISAAYAINLKLDKNTSKAWRF